jgi:hypothetical protein
MWRSGDDGMAGWHAAEVARVIVVRHGHMTSLDIGIEGVCEAPVPSRQTIPAAWVPPLSDRLPQHLAILVDAAAEVELRLGRRPAR